MSQSPRRKTSAPIPAGRWAAYAAAGAASALGTQAAEAAVIYSGILDMAVDNPARSVPGPTVPADAELMRFDLDGGAKLRFFDSYSKYDDVGFGAFKFNVQNGATGGSAMLAATPSGSYAFADRLRRRKDLATTAMIAYSGFASLAFASFYSQPGTGEFLNRSRRGRYVGFKFDVGAGSQYGWARVSNRTGSTSNFFTLTDYAFGDPGQALVTGQCNEDGSLVGGFFGACNPANLDRTGVSAGGTPPINVPGQIPVPGSLGLLALGAVGLAATRQRRTRAKDSSAATAS